MMFLLVVNTRCGWLWFPFHGWLNSAAIGALPYFYLKTRGIIKQSEVILLVVEDMLCFWVIQTIQIPICYHLLVPLWIHHLVAFSNRQTRQLLKYQWIASSCLCCEKGYMQLYEIKPSTADYRGISGLWGEAFIVHCPHFVRPSKVPRGNRNQCDLTQNSPVHNWPFVDLWRWNADTELFSQPLNELSICPECCEREVNSLVGHESFLPVINIPAFHATP